MSWVGTGFDRILLSREAKSIPTHGMEDIVPSHALVTGYNICCSITFGMTYMKTCATVSEVA